MIRGPSWVRGPDGDSKSSASDNTNLREVAEERVFALQATIDFWRIFAEFCAGSVYEWFKLPLVLGYCPAVLLGVLGVPVVALALGMKPVQMVLTIILPGVFALLLTEGRSTT